MESISSIILCKTLDFYATNAYNKNAGSLNPLYTRATERKFKRYVLSPDTGWPLKSGFSFTKGLDAVDIFVYSDESGVFDRVHNEFFVFGGIIFLSKESRDNCVRMYSKAERDVKKSICMASNQEAKASNIPNRYKSKLFRALNNQHRFGVIIKQDEILNEIFASKKDRQRYLDFAYKIAVKRMLEKLIRSGEITESLVDTITFYVDQHTTATNGRYELQQALEQELKSGTYNNNYSIYFPPLFPSLKALNLQYCNSSKNFLIRAADIVANKIFYLARENGAVSIDEENLFVITLPHENIRN